MTQGMKFTFFVVALCVMACFAAAGVMMGEHRPGIAVLLFVAAFVATAGGFVAKRKVMKR